MDSQSTPTLADRPATVARPSVAVWKFASCDGCQLSLLDCEDELLAVADRVEIAVFAEATSTTIDGPWDVSFVEGSITTARDAERIRTIREQTTVLVAIGACATAGGIQALRNDRDLAGVASVVYGEPELVSALPTSTPIGDHVDVDLALHGCPIDPGQLLATIAALADGHLPRLATAPVCTDCKSASITCVTVASGLPCLGPVTRTGCGAICPRFGRGCYGCFGPVERPNLTALRDRFARLGLHGDEIDRLLATFNVRAFAAAPADDMAGEVAGDGEQRP